MSFLSLLSAYLIGSIPMGLILVRLVTREDLRKVHSGRTGGTNAMRAAGFGVGFLTGVLDFTKAAAAIWLTKNLTHGNPWVVAGAGVVCVLGHNYSLFLMERTDGRLRFTGGAGGAPIAGAAMGIWSPSALIVVPIGLLILFGVGYASLATLTAGLVAGVVFTVRAMMGEGSWAYVLFALIAEIILLWGLRPNIERLRQGTERRIGRRVDRS
jgi:glycerol-3-phosphate acyltransferase PlsY